MFKKKAGPAEISLLLVNLLPVIGVWFFHWSAMEVFVIYCFETIIVGIYNVLRMAITGTIVKSDVWNTQGSYKTYMPAAFFIIFFIIHYGFFVAIQLSIFLPVSGAEKALGISGLKEFFTKFPGYLSVNSRWLLLAFVASYGFITVKDFILNGAYRRSSLSLLLFQPYSRIFIQQFTVIAGSLFLGFGAGKIFITVFAGVKIFFDVFVDYQKIINNMAEKQRASQ